MADWSNIPISENDEKLVLISADRILRHEPHVYTTEGAVYGEGFSPFMMREGAASALLRAQDYLTMEAPQHRIVIFDALRPIDIQKQMRRLYALNYAREQGLDVGNRSDMKQAFYYASEYWANPTYDPTTPPPHSTGGAVDLYIVDADGHPLEMGTDVDTGKQKSEMHFYENAKTARAIRLHDNRMLLKYVMEKAGFTHNPREWWHFDFGNQRWAYEMRRKGLQKDAVAAYGLVNKAHLPDHRPFPVTPACIPAK